MGVDGPQFPTHTASRQRIEELKGIMMMTRKLPQNDDLANDSATTDCGFGALETPSGRLPLIALDVRCNICGLSAQTTVCQTFRNSTSEFLEATYIFPLPDRAAVTGFELLVAGRRIEGLLKERGAAREDYDRAIRQGHRAAIVEEDRAGVFSMRVGNLPPHESIQVRLTLCGPLPVSEGEATFRFPLVVAPRYTPGIPLEGESVGLGTAADTNLAPDASRVTPPVLLPGFPNPVRLSLEVTLDPRGLSDWGSDSVTSQWLSGLRSSLHATVVDVGQRLTVKLQPSERLNRDFILRLPVATTQMRTSMRIESTNPESAHVAVLTLVPPTIEAASLKPRDVVFVLDRSGSMEGWKLVAARRAVARMIDSLLAQDRFTVIAFDTLVEWACHEKSLRPATDRERWRVLEWLSKVRVNGGTEMHPALTAAVSILTDEGARRVVEPIRDRTIVFVTDGEVTNEDHLLDAMKKYGAVLPRIHCVGIDQAVNAAFLKRLSDLGKGLCELVESEDRLDQALTRIQRVIGEPVLKNLEITSLEGQWNAVAPQLCVDLFADRPITIYGRVPRGERGLRLQLTAQRADGSKWSYEVMNSVTEPEVSESKFFAESRVPQGLLAEWGRARIRDLEDAYACDHSERRSELSRKVIEASLESRALSRFTAFVAVDQQEVVNVGGDVEQFLQPVETPAGWGAVCAAPMAGGSAHLFGSIASAEFDDDASAFDDEDLLVDDDDCSVDSMLCEFTETQIDFSCVSPDTESPIARLISIFLADAISRRATSIRFELKDGRFDHFLVITGTSHIKDSIPVRLHGAVLRRFCELASIEVPSVGAFEHTTFEHILGTQTLKIELTIDRRTSDELITLNFVEQPASDAGTRDAFWK